MRDRDCIGFLQWALPQLGLRWAGFRKVRGTVCKRVARRMRALGLASAGEYRAYLAASDDEWGHLDAMCRIPISRFWRDRKVFDTLAADVLPALAAASGRNDRLLRFWSAGCASGEEAYSLRLAWSLSAESLASGPQVTIVATDADEAMVARAKAGRYEGSSMRDLPPKCLERAFQRLDGLLEIRPQFRRDVRFLMQDIRSEQPDGPFDLVLCRNLVFTYFDTPTQREVLARIRARLRPAGALVIGSNETLPEPHPAFVRWHGLACVYRSCGTSGHGTR